MTRHWPLFEAVFSSESHHELPEVPDQRVFEERVSVCLVVIVEYLLEENKSLVSKGFGNHRISFRLIFGWTISVLEEENDWPGDFRSWFDDA